MKCSSNWHPWSFAHLTTTSPTFSFNISTFLQFYFQIIQFLLSFSKPCFNVVKIFAWVFLFITPNVKYLHFMVLLCALQGSRLIYLSDIIDLAFFEKLTLAINCLFLYFDEWMHEQYHIINNSFFIFFIFSLYVYVLFVYLRFFK